MGRNNDFIFYHPDDPEYDGGPVAPGDKYVFVHDYDNEYDDEFYDDYILNDDDDSLPDYGAAHHNNNGAPDHLFNLFYDEFNKHYDHLNADAPTAAAINYVNNHDYDSPPDNFVQYVQYVQYVNDYYASDASDDNHLVNKHHNYD
jgi:hypothetical protein